MEEKNSEIFQGISSYRMHGRCYGMMFCLGEQTGRDMKSLTKEKGTEILTMLELSNEFPEEFKLVSQFSSIEDKLKESESKYNFSDSQVELDVLRGAIEAKLVYLSGKKWERLLELKDIKSKEDACNIEDNNGEAEQSDNDNNPYGKLPVTNMIKFEENGLFGLKDNNGNILINAEYEDISCGYNGRGWKLKKDGKWGLINENRETLFPIKYDSIEIQFESGFIVELNDKFGYLDKYGKQVLDYEYDSICTCDSKLKLKKNKKYGYADNDGKIIVPTQYDSIDPYCYHPLIEVELGNKYGCYNYLGEIVLPIFYDHLLVYEKEKTVVAKKDGKYGFIDFSNNIIVPFEYDDFAEGFYHSYKGASKNGKYGLIDKRGQIIIDFKYDYLSSASDNSYLVAKFNGKYGFITINEDVVIPFMYENAQPFYNGYSVVSMGYENQTGLIDEHNKVVVPLIYDRIRPYFDDCAEVELIVRNEKRWRQEGVYDMKNQIGSPCIYDDVTIRHRNEDGNIVYKCRNEGEEWKQMILKKGTDRSYYAVNNRIALARDFSLILNENGSQTLLGRNEQFRQLQSDLSDPIINIAASFAGYMGLTRSGRVVTGGRAREFDCYDEIESWRDVIDIKSSEGHTVALFRNGTVACADESGGFEDTPKRFKEVVNTWKNMKQVAVGYDNIIGLTNEGQVLYDTRDARYEDNSLFHQLKNVIQVDAFSWYYGNCNAAVLLSDGTVITNYGDTYKWGDIVHISIDGNGNIVGLLRNGHVVGDGDEEMKNFVSTLTNIVSIECKYFKVVALNVNGEIFTWNV